MLHEHWTKQYATQRNEMDNTEEENKNEKKKQKQNENEENGCLKLTVSSFFQFFFFLLQL